MNTKPFNITVFIEIIYREIKNYDKIKKRINKILGNYKIYLNE